MIKMTLKNIKVHFYKLVKLHLDDHKDSKDLEIMHNIDIKICITIDLQNLPKILKNLNYL